MLMQDPVCLCWQKHVRLPQQYAKHVSYGVADGWSEIEGLDCWCKRDRVRDAGHVPPLDHGWRSLGWRSLGQQRGGIKVLLLARV
jgi:hypothetical protein